MWFSGCCHWFSLTHSLRASSLTKPAAPKGICWSQTTKQIWWCWVFPWCGDRKMKQTCLKTQSHLASYKVLGHWPTSSRSHGRMCFGRSEARRVTLRPEHIPPAETWKWSGSDAVRQNTWAPISYFVISCLFLSFFFFRSSSLHTVSLPASSLVCVCWYR